MTRAQRDYVVEIAEKHASVTDFATPKIVLEKISTDA